MFLSVVRLGHGPTQGLKSNLCNFVIGYDVFWLVVRIAHSRAVPVSEVINTMFEDSKRSLCNDCVQASVYRCDSD